MSDPRSDAPTREAVRQRLQRDAAWLHIENQIRAMSQAEKLHPHDWAVLRRVVFAAVAYEERRANALRDERDKATHAGELLQKQLAAAGLLRPTPDWQPIESAPKMHTILLFAVTETCEDGSVGNWKMATGVWHTGYEDESSRAAGYSPWTWDGNQLRTYHVQPTHWMPLPAPPVVA